MKNLFQAYYKPCDNEFDELWKKSIFIFDTNVLLNLYRYQQTTRDALLNILEKLSNRIWIPYHVGLEFQRNRLKVIHEQYKKYEEVKKIVNDGIDSIQKGFENLQIKNRHSHITPDKLIDEIAKLKEKFFKDLDLLETKSISVTTEDRIRNRLDKVFQDGVGLPPKNQEDINRIFFEGEKRYKLFVPPGYKDAAKTNNEDYSYGGITYQAQYGDLIIWMQIIDYAKENNLKDIIYITDDNKPDWWWTIGGKTIGARPELLEEIKREAGVERFQMYTTENFLKYANKYLDAKITKESIEEVRDISVAQNIFGSKWSKARLSEQASINALIEWLTKNSEFSHISRNYGFPDLTVINNGQKYGYEIKLLTRVSIGDIVDQIYRAIREIDFKNYKEITLVYIIDNDVSPDSVIKAFEHRPVPPCNVKLMIGRLHQNEIDPQLFNYVPIYEVAFDNH